MRQPCAVLCVAFSLSPILAAPRQAQKAAPVLRVGAAKVDITPAPDSALPLSGYGGRTDGFKGIHDDLTVRAIVVDDGTNQAALIGCEVIGLSFPLVEKIVTRLAKETGIPGDRILLSAVHTHAAPALGTYNEPAEGDVAKRRSEYVQKLEDAIVTAVRQAKAALQPARVGYGTGKVTVNMNRRARTADGGWMLGNNPEGVSDKTVAVIRFENVSGQPIAIYANYAVHGTVLGPGNLQVSSDLPGAASRAVEKHYGGSVVSPWTSGAAGDQDPIYRTGTDFRNVDALGQILAEEIVRVADSIKAVTTGRIRGFQKMVSCPGKRTVQSPGPNREYKIEDADPVQIRLSLLLIHDIALAGVSGEVLTNIGSRLKRESSFNHTIMVTHTNGSSGYLPDDAAYDQVSYEIITTRVKRGCAEDSIVNGFVELMRALF
jgi:neutral/alkaline ceramidase-like enzyme